MIQSYEGVESLACRLLLILNYASFEMVVKRPVFVVVLCSCFCKICLWHSWTFDSWLWQRRIHMFLILNILPSDLLISSVSIYFLYSLLVKVLEPMQFYTMFLAISSICQRERVTSLAGSELMKKRGLILLASPATFENTPFGILVTPPSFL